MIVFDEATRVEPDEMPHYVAFHLGLHCLPEMHFGVKHILLIFFKFYIIINLCVLVLHWFANTKIIVCNIFFL